MVYINLTYVFLQKWEEIQVGALKAEGFVKPCF